MRGIIIINFHPVTNPVRSIGLTVIRLRPQMSSLNRITRRITQDEQNEDLDANK